MAAPRSRTRGSGKPGRRTVTAAQLDAEAASRARARTEASVPAVKEAGVLARTVKLLNDAIARVHTTTHLVESRADDTLGSAGEGTDVAEETRGVKAGQAREVEGLALELHMALAELGRQVDRLGEL